MQALTNLITTLALVIGLWIYCRRASTRGKLNQRWYMFIVAFACSGFVGLWIYAHYVRRQGKLYATLPISN